MRKWNSKTIQVRGKQRPLTSAGKQIFIIFLVMLGAGTLRFVFHELLHKNPVPQDHIPTQEWKKYSPGGSPLSLLLPGGPEPESLGVPEALPGEVEHVSLHKYSNEQLQVVVWDILYADGVAADIRKAADGAVSTLKQSGGVTEYSGSSTPVSRSGRSGLQVQGTFKRYGVGMKIEALLLGDGPRLWEVITTYPAAETGASEAARRILDSTTIEWPISYSRAQAQYEL